MKVVGIMLFITTLLTSCGDSIKVAYANNKQIFDEFELTENLTKKLKDKKVASQLTLDSLKFELVELKKKIEAKPEPDNALIKTHQLIYNEFLTKEKLFTNSNEALALKYDEQIMTQLNEYIKNYAKENDIDFLLGAGNSNILYAEKTKDVTKDLIEYSNLKFRGK